MPLVLQPASNRAEASGGQTVFNYTFTDRGTKISPILVFTLLVGATNRVEQTILIDYTLDRDAKTITFLVGLAAGTIVDIERGTNRTRDVIHDPASTITGAILNRDEEQSFRYTQELEEQIARKLGLNDRRDQFLAANRRIITLADAVNQQDAMNRRSTQALITGAGNLPAPGAGVVGFVLTAINPTTWLPRDRGVPVPSTGEEGFLLEVDSAGEGGYSFHDRGVPIPQTADVDRLLQAIAAGEGGYEYGVSIPRPTTGDTDKHLIVSGVDQFKLTTIALESQPNALINGDFRVVQRGSSFNSTTTPANNDNTYLLDRWVLLSNGNNVVNVNQANIVPDGAFASMRSRVTGAGAGLKFGHLTVLEARDTARLLKDGDLSRVSLSFKAQTDTGFQLNNLRAAVVTWEGTADVITRDIVATWEASGVDPTLVSQWSYQNTPSDLALVLDVFTEFKIENIIVIAPTAGIQNIGVVIWLDDTDSVDGDTVIIADVKLEPGASTTAFTPRPIAEELEYCRRYWQQSYSQGVEAQTVTDAGQLAYRTALTSADSYRAPLRFNPLLRITNATVTLYSPFTGTAGQMRADAVPGDIPAAVVDLNDAVAGIRNTGSTTPGLHRVHFTADAEL